MTDDLERLVEDHLTSFHRQYVEHIERHDAPVRAYQVREAARRVGRRRRIRVRTWDAETATHAVVIAVSLEPLTDVEQAQRAEHALRVAEQVRSP